MLYFIIFCCLTQIIISTVGMILLRMIHKAILEEKTQKAQKTTRVHSKIKTSNYNSSYGARAYDIYKNKDGLYEPQRPRQGIELNAKKEE